MLIPILVLRVRQLITYNDMLATTTPAPSVVATGYDSYGDRCHHPSAAPPNKKHTCCLSGAWRGIAKFDMTNDENLAIDSESANIDLKQVKKTSPGTAKQRIVYIRNPRQA